MSGLLNRQYWHQPGFVSADQFSDRRDGRIRQNHMAPKIWLLSFTRPIPVGYIRRQALE